jgi:hypothetical protein
MKVTSIKAALAIGALVSLGPAGNAQQRTPSAPVLEVYKTPTCGCCTKWVEHMQANGFTVRVTDLSDLVRIKAAHSIPDNLQSCHTAVIGGYAIEGHVPAADVQRLLKERPAIAGIAVAGMPVGSPGMEYEGRVQQYEVTAFDKQGKMRTFAVHGR